MDWTVTVEKRLKNRNQILFYQTDECLRRLSNMALEQSRRGLVLWAIEFAEETVGVLEKKYPHEDRPRSALEAAKRWAAGDVKMRAAQRAILNCHAFAKEIINPEDIAMCHAVGQACGVVHTPRHALGYPIYDLTAIVYREGSALWKQAVEYRVEQYIKRLLYWSKHVCDCDRKWADFLNYETEQGRMMR